MGLVGDGERMTRVNLLLEVEQAGEVRALADDLGRRGVKIPFAAVMRAAIDAGIEPVRAAYGVQRAR